MVVLTGGSLEWQTEAEYLNGAKKIGTDVPNQVWVCSGKNGKDAENGHGKMTLVKDGPSIINNTSMADPVTLQGFVDYAAETYPAEKYDLILWDHGGGPHGGFALDDLHYDDKAMSLAEMVSALQNSSVEHFDMIDFDACLMGSVEVVAAFGDMADSLVLSSETEPGYGQNYIAMLSALTEDSNMDSYEFSKKIVDGYLAFYEDEKSPGFEQTATLTAIDSRNFKDRLMGPVSELANHMNAELSKPGEKNQKFNYYDEYIASAISYAYSEPEMLDLGSFAGTLGISMYEIDNDPFYEDLSNSYSGISTNLQKVLADQDSSGDDVLYNRFTKDLTKENGNKMGVVRAEDGKITREENISPSGLTVYFAPMNLYYTTQYANAIDELCRVIKDEQARGMLQAIKQAAVRYALAAAAGNTVSQLADAGHKKITVNDVLESWQEERDLSEAEISLFQDQIGTGANITGMKASPWRICIWMLAGILMEDVENPPEETEDALAEEIFLKEWLKPIVEQQVGERIADDSTRAVSLDNDGDGTTDAYRVTVDASMRLIKDVSMNFYADVKQERDEISLAVFGEKVKLGKINGSLYTENLPEVIGEEGTIEDGYRTFYTQDKATYDIPTSIDSWYELVDSEGKGHLITAGEVDLTKDQSLKIPVLMIEDKNSDEDISYRFGFLVYNGKKFNGFIEVNLEEDTGTAGRLVSLKNPMFNDVQFVTAECMEADFFGSRYYIMGEISQPFKVPKEPSADRGMTVRRTPLSEIADLKDGKVTTEGIITDLFTYNHNINAALEKAE